MKLNPIQILDLQDLAKQETNNLYDKLSKAKCLMSKQIYLSEIKRMESSVAILDAMFSDACEEENFATTDFEQAN